MTVSVSSRVRDLNDAFRAAGPFAGDWMVTVGVQAFGPAVMRQACEQARHFDRFTEDNDPYGEHDFGSFELSGQTLFWKIDCYDLDLLHGSTDPGNPAVTRRVLTLMLASEY